MKDPTVRDKAADMEKLIVALVEGSEEKLLDELVRDAASLQASKVNANGIPSQVSFLLYHWGADNTALAIKEAMKNDFPME